MKTKETINMKNTEEPEKKRITDSHVLQYRCLISSLFNVYVFFHIYERTRIVLYIEIET